MADTQAPPERRLMLERLYVKDVSFESPMAPGIFHSNATAQNSLNVSAGSRGIDDERVEVTLTVRITSHLEDRTVFAIEVAQAGLFVIDGYAPHERHVLLNSFCPGMLYPYAREVVADFAAKGGFPELVIQPLDFNLLYAQNAQAGTAREVEPGNTTTAVPGNGAASPLGS